MMGAANKESCGQTSYKCHGLNKILGYSFHTLTSDHFFEGHTGGVLHGSRSEMITNHGSWILKFIVPDQENY